MINCLRLNVFNYSKLFIRMSSSLGSNEVELKIVNQVACLSLNRPKQLNSLNLSMVKLMQNHLEECENNSKIKAVIVKGAGEVAFCAGGDVKSIRDFCIKGQKDKAMEFFREEYKLNYKIANYKKPYIALINGITMGGGVGVSIHGKYRVATEKTLFAMPETAIGFFADVGGSYFLPRLKDHIGLFLVLTGNRLKGQDVKRTGLATHYLDSSKLLDLESKFYESNNLSFESVDKILNDYTEKIETEYDSQKISRIFNASSLEKIIENLEKDNSDWAKKQLKLLAKMSPTSLKIAIKQLELGARKNLKECLEMEYQLCLRFTSKNDFMEGVRAVLVDKGDKCNWIPPTYQEVDDNIVEWYFRPLPNDDKLVL